MDGLEQFREFARDCKRALAAQHVRDVGNAADHAVRRLIKYQQVRQRPQRCEFPPARCGLLRQETVEQEMRRREAGGGQCAYGCIGAGDGNHWITSFPHRSHRDRAGIGNRGRAGIADERHGFSLRQQAQDFPRGVALIVLVQRDKRRGDPVVLQEPHGNPRILGGNGGYALEHVKRAQRDIGKVSNRCGDYI